MTADTLDLCGCVASGHREAFLERDRIVSLVADFTEGAMPGCLPHRLHDAWVSPAFPGRDFGVELAVRMFRQAGYMTDTDGGPPTEPVDIYRAQVGPRYGMSWTTQRGIAEWFHDRNLFYGFGDRAILLRGIVEPEGVLAYWRWGRGTPGNESCREDEVVVNPKYLRRPVERLTYAAPTTDTGGTPWTLTSVDCVPAEEAS